VANYVQGDFRNPANLGATIQVENIGNPLRVTAPQPLFTQPGVNARALLVDQLKGTYMGNSKRINLDGTSTST